MYFAVTFATSLCWSRESHGHDAQTGRHRHLVYVKRCGDLGEAFDALRVQNDETQRLIFCDERHRLFPVYEFVVARDKKHLSSPKVRRSSTTTSGALHIVETLSKKTPAGTTISTNDDGQIIDLDYLLRTLRFVSVGVHDPSIERLVRHLVRRTACEAITVVLLSDANVRNWCGALADYLLPIDCHCTTCFDTRSSRGGGDVSSSFSSSSSIKHCRPDEPKYKRTQANNTTVATLPTTSIADEENNLQFACDRIKSRVDECI